MTDVEKRQQNYKSAERRRSHQAAIDWPAVERAENEGLKCYARTGDHPAPDNDLPREHQSSWLDTGTTVIAVVKTGQFQRQPRTVTMEGAGGGAAEAHPLTSNISRDSARLVAARAD